MERIRWALRTSCWDRGHGLEQLSGYVRAPRLGGSPSAACVANDVLGVRLTAQPPRRPSSDASCTIPCTRHTQKALP